MLKAIILTVVATLIVVVVVGYSAVTMGWIRANADAKPLPFEIWTANKGLDATLSKEAPKDPNPVALSDENLIAGIEIYGKNCVICHGTALGESSETALAKGLYIQPPQLAIDGVEDDPEGHTFWTIKHGIRWTAMPSWKNALSDEQIWTLALFLKHMNNLPPKPEQVWKSISMPSEISADVSK